MRNAGLGIDVNDFIDGEKGVIGGSEFDHEVADAALRGINQHPVYRAYRFVLRIAQFEAGKGAAGPRHVLCGKVAKPVGC